MFALSAQQKYFQKEVVLPNGSKAIVFFELVETNGRIVARAVNVQIISEAKASASVVYLPVSITRAIFAPVVAFYSNYVAPIVEELSFITSQPTRAPSLV